jgi:tRNA threonylcarbamoyladenosine biosynthesis protein TsaB
MQTKPVTPTYCALAHFTYHTVVIAVGSQESYRVREISAREASSLMIPQLQELLAELSLQLDDVSYLASTVGPGPFTTLRTVIATMNGLGFATHLPLIELNTIEVFVRSAHNSSVTHTCVLLNAFCQDIYYAWYDGNQLDIGCTSFDQWLNRTKAFVERHSYARIQFLGNAVKMYADQLIATQLMTSDQLSNIPEMPDIKSMLDAAHNSWTVRKTVAQLTPFYGKSAAPALTK